MKFVADKMLGRLTKWLRIVGQDVTYGSHLSGYGLIREARREGRVILTRDRQLGKKNPPDFFLVQSDRFREQLKEIVLTFRLDPFKDVFTRCVECNTVLKSIEKEQVKEKVPPYVFSTQAKFSFCHRCKRIYWPATHQQKMVEELRVLAVDQVEFTRPV